MHTPTVTDKNVKAFASKGFLERDGKQIKTLWDGGGLHLDITSAGSAVWRIKYRHDRKERSYTIGAYPKVGLKEARQERERVKALLREGRDPVQDRRLQVAAATTAAGNTFADIMRSWLEYERNRKSWSLIHYTKSKRALERDVIPYLGKLPVADITPVMVTNMVKAITARGVRDTAAKILQHVTGVFEYAQAHGLRNDNPARPAQKVLPKADVTKRRPALLDWAQLGDVLRRAEAANLSRAVRMAHRLTAFTVARISNIVQAEWKEFDLDAEVPLWTIPRAKMKAHDRLHDHKVVLCPKIAEELREWREVMGGKGYLFPGAAGGQHVTREALEKAYRVTLGLEDKHTPHGWRAAFATLARDESEGNFGREVVELTLDHVADTDVARAYDRGERLTQRLKLMTWWGEQLTRMQRGADVAAKR